MDKGLLSKGVFPYPAERLPHTQTQWFSQKVRMAKTYGADNSGNLSMGFLTTFKLSGYGHQLSGN
jgi:hypothetical protein